MRYLKYVLLALLLLNSPFIFAQTVLVTSNEDAGSGTLREALINIPVIRTQPYIIHFNLPGATPANDASRTIRLRSQLPAIPSNVVIDGGSQNWPELGVSGAKIIIEPESANTPFTSCLTIGNFSDFEVQTSNVEIYGLYIKDFAKITTLQNPNTNQGSGIIIDSRANNIKIGAPGKGNVISGNINGILIQNSYYYNTTVPLTEINIRSNLIGVHYDGMTAVSNITGISANLYECSLSVGGDNPGDGNVISANQTNLNITRNTYASADRFDINIINNKIGTNYDGTADFHELPLFLLSSSIELSGLKVDALNTSLYVRKNVISGNRTTGITIANANFVLTGNSIGTGVLGTEELGNGIGIEIGPGAGGTIGGDTPEANKIAYNNYGIESLSARPVIITRNSMYCNYTFGIGKTQNIIQPYVQVLVRRANFLSGKATPNSAVELFYTENCHGLCEGKKYFATTQAGSDGRWTYNGTITGNVDATATLLDATTSPFSTAEVLDNEVLIEPVTCLGNGSIKVPEPREGITFSWKKVLSDGSKVPLSNDQQILDLEEGSYELTTDDGCNAVIHPLFEIKDQRLTDPVVNVPVPQCGETSFVYSASVQRGKGEKKYEWIQAGVVVAVGPQVTMPEGTYTVKVTDEAGCMKESAEFTVKMRPTPRIDNSQIQYIAAACGFPNGSIKGIQILTPTGALTYRWNIYNTSTSAIGAEVGHALDLENVLGGSYILTVKDEGDCPPVSFVYNITIYNSVIINGGTVTRTTCNSFNGTINGITIAEANTYQWIGPAGQMMEHGAYSPGQVLKLLDLAPGTYTLKATNSVTGCENVRTFQVDEIPPTQYILNEQVNAATCGLDNGSIALNYTSVQPTTFKWEDASGTVLPTGTTRELRDLAPGTYRFFAYDVNGCETVFGPYVIDRTPILSIEPLSAVVVNDGCSLLRGSVTGIRVNGGIPPYNYSWENEAGTLIQSTRDLTGVPGGKYKLILRDNTSCGIATSADYTVENPSFPISTPVANDMRVCYATEIMLQVMAPEEGTYQLYKEVTDATPILESTNQGIFVFKVSKTGDYKIRRRLGTCYSEFSTVHIEVTNDNLQVMNTMTPNGDGINDTWTINGLPDYGDINIKLYTRSGQLVYESVGRYNKAFDGYFRGKELPAGVYYYRIDLRADCKPLGGSLTLLR